MKLLECCSCACKADDDPSYPLLAGPLGRRPLCTPSLITPNQALPSAVTPTPTAPPHPAPGSGANLMGYRKCSKAAENLVKGKFNSLFASGLKAYMFNR